MMMNGCRCIHEGVEADQVNDFPEAHAQYTKALEIFGDCDDGTLGALGEIMGGTREDARGLIERAKGRAQELRAIVRADEQPDDETEKTEAGSKLPSDPPAVLGGAVEVPKEELKEPNWECATPRAMPATPVPVALRESTASPTGSTRSSYISNISNLRTSSMGCSFIEESMAMTPQSCPQQAPHSCEATTSPKDEVTEEDILDMHLIIKNLDTGAVVQLSHDTIQVVSRPKSEPDALLIKRMIRNLDTGDVRLLKEEPTKKNSFLSALNTKTFKLW